MEALYTLLYYLCKNGNIEEAEEFILLNKKLFPLEVEGFNIILNGGFLIGMTLAVLVTMTVATSMAARDGPVPVAGYQICLEVWLALSLLNDALAIAGQVKP
ncbi:hypothetical protein POM88_052331 [Heracleum sosnowskyi]|uniref:Uncharacterized protein n=1 Tax=Heracleum sosnowskyi TaxID=360622 RepID=A0AAD8GRA5_9APIA|nr:hypothetical protein POM88_052331 [Heracleum sosnowskyi]